MKEIEKRPFRERLFGISTCENWKMFVALSLAESERRISPSRICLARRSRAAVGGRGGSFSLALLNMFHLPEIRRCETLSSVLVCMDALPKLAAHHTLALNWGNWLSRERISPLVNSACCVQPDELKEKKKPNKTLSPSFSPPWGLCAAELFLCPQRWTSLRVK